MKVKEMLDRLQGNTLITLSEDRAGITYHGEVDSAPFGKWSRRTVKEISLGELNDIIIEVIPDK